MQMSKLLAVLPTEGENKRRRLAVNQLRWRRDNDRLAALSRLSDNKPAVLRPAFHLASHHQRGGFGVGGVTAWCASLKGESVCSVNFCSASGRNNSQDKLPVNRERGEERKQWEGGEG